jgi:hypothetical protein
VDGSDSIIRLDYTESDHTFYIPVSGVISDVLPDPDNWLLDVITILKKPLQNGTFIINPNPFTDEIWVEFNNSNIKREIIISDMTGKMLGRYETECAVISIPMKSIVRGIYLITVVENGESFTARIVKK